TFIKFGLAATTQVRCISIPPRTGNPAFSGIPDAPHGDALIVRATARGERPCGDKLFLAGRYGPGTEVPADGNPRLTAELQDAFPCLRKGRHSKKAPDRTFRFQ